MTFASAILPIFLLMAAGYLLTATRVVPRENWPAIEGLVFRVLIPVVLIDALVGVDLNLSRIGPFALCILATTGVMTVILLAVRVMMSRDHLENRRFTSIFQAATRWNAFIAFVASDQIVGPDGRAVIAIAVALLIPTINVLNITILAAFGPETRTTAQVLRTIARNPLVLGCAIGLTINMSGITPPAPLLNALEILGDGALGIGLLAVGGGIALSRLAAVTPAVWAAIMLRAVISPAIFLALASFTDLSPTELFLGALVMSVPAATNGYIVAKQMGGDADLYADILTWHTALAIFALPLLAAMLL